MTIELHAIQRAALTEEANNAFAVDVTGSATYVDLPVQENTGQLQLSKPTLDPQIQQQRLDARNKLELGPKSATFSFTVPMGATGVAAGDGATSPAYTDQGLLYLLKLGFGGANDSNTGGTVTSAAAEYQFIGSPANWDGGECVGWVNASGRIEARAVAAETGSTIRTRDQLSTIPSASDVLYAGTTIHPTTNPDTSIQMIVEGAEEDDRWLLMGGQLTSFGINLTLGQIGAFTFTIEFADWASEPSQAITVADYSTFSPLYGWEALRTINGAANGGSIAGACLDASSVEITMNAPVYAKVMSGCGTNTVKRWRRTRAVPFSAWTLTLPYEDTSWFTERDDQEYYGLTIQVGHVAGKTILIEMPRAQVTDVQRTDADGLAYQAVTFEATTDSFVTQADDDDIRYAAFRIHFL